MKSIRISITDKCDLDCYYCHNEGQALDEVQMSPFEIEKLLEIAASIGITKVKLTGGEPLLRNDIVEIVKRAKKHMKEVSITTNGIHLAELARSLKDAGLDRVNISLDTFDPVKYTKITGKNSFEKALDGILKAVVVGLNPVKVNVVMLEDSTTEGIIATMEGVWELGAIPQIIEPIGDAGWSSLDEVEEFMSKKAIKFWERELHKRKKFILLDANGREREVELVRPMHNTKFCAYCTRIRVTSGGKFKSCLMHNDGLIDILTPIKEGADNAALKNAFEKAINNRRPYWK